MFGISTNQNGSSTQTPVEPSTSSRVEQSVNLLGVSIIFALSASINFAIAPDPLSALLGTVVLTGLSCLILHALRRVEWSHFFSYSFDALSSPSTHVIHHHTDSWIPPQPAVLITDPPTSNRFVPHVPQSDQGRGQPTSHLGSVAGGIRAEKKGSSPVSDRLSSPGWFSSHVSPSDQGRGQPTSHLGSVAGGMRAEKKGSSPVSDRLSSPGWFSSHVSPSDQGRDQPTSHLGSVAGGIRAEKKGSSPVSDHWSSPGWFSSHVSPSDQGRDQPTSHLGSVAGGIRAEKKGSSSVSDHWSSDDDQLTLGVGITGSRAMKKQKH